MKKLLVAIAVAGGATVGLMGSTPTAPVKASDTPILVVVGDSITAGSKLEVPWRDAWPSLMAQDLFNSYQVQNDAIGGQCLVATQCWNTAPGTIVAEWDRLLDQGNVKAAIIAGGTNDLSHVDNATFTWAYVEMMHDCQVRGIACWVSTITPQGSEWPWFAQTEAQREQVNAWLRSTYPNQLIDFDAVEADPTDHLWSAYDNGDGLHPNWVGEVKMAEEVPLGALRGVVGQ